MTTNAMLTNDEILDLGLFHHATGPYSFARAVEQAVLQSPEIQVLRRDAGRWQEFRRAASADDWKFLGRVNTYIRSAIDNADGTPTEDQVDAAIDAAKEKQP